MVMKCDLCEGRLIMQSGGKSAVCADCGMEYSFERLKEKIAEARDATKKEKQDALPSSETVKEDKVPEPGKAEPAVYEAAWEDEPAEEATTVYEAVWEDDSAEEEPTIYEAEWEDEPAEEEPTVYEAQWEDEPAENHVYMFKCERCGKIFDCNTTFVDIPYCDECVAFLHKHGGTKTCSRCGKQYPEYIKNGMGICQECKNSAIESGELQYVTNHCPHCGREISMHVGPTAIAFRCAECKNIGYYSLTQVSKEEQYVYYCRNCRKIIYCGTERVHIPYCEDCIPIIQQQYPKMVKCKKCKTLIPEYVNREFKLCIDCMNQEIYSGNIVKRESTCTHCGAESARYVYATAPGAYINCPSCGKRYSAYYTKYKR